MLLCGLFNFIPHVSSLKTCVMELCFNRCTQLQWQCFWRWFYLYIFSVWKLQFRCYTLAVLFFFWNSLAVLLVLLHWGSCSSLFVLTCFNPLFAALLGHYHLYNFPADVFYACAHACWIATNFASNIKVGSWHC